MSSQLRSPLLRTPGRTVSTSLSGRGGLSRRTPSSPNRHTFLVGDQQPVLDDNDSVPLIADDARNVLTDEMHTMLMTKTETSDMGNIYANRPLLDRYVNNLKPALRKTDYDLGLDDSDVGDLLRLTFQSRKKTVDELNTRARSIASNVTSRRQKRSDANTSLIMTQATKAELQAQLDETLAKVQALQLEIGGQADYEEQQVKVLDDLEEEYQHAQFLQDETTKLNALSLFIHQSQDPKIRLLALLPLDFINKCLGLTKFTDIQMLNVEELLKLFMMMSVHGLDLHPEWQVSNECDCHFPHD